MGGWIKLHRSLMKHWLFSFEDPDKALAWIDMLMSTNYKPGKVRRNGVLIDLERGELGQSANGLAERWGWSRGKVIRFLEELESDKMIVQHKDKRRGKISICNYESYQSDCGEDGTTGGTTDNTTGDATGGQQADNTKEVNKINKGKKSSAARLPSIPWDEILKAYNEILPEFVSHDSVLADAKANITKIWRDEPKYRDIDFWKAYFTGIRDLEAEFAHWRGDNDRNRKYGTLEFITHNKRFYVTRDKLRDKARKERTGI